MPLPTAVADHVRRRVCPFLGATLTHNVDVKFIQIPMDKIDLLEERIKLNLKRYPYTLVDPNYAALRTHKQIQSCIIGDFTQIYGYNADN